MEQDMMDRIPSVRLGWKRWAAPLAMLAVLAMVVAALSLTIEASEDETLAGDVAVAEEVQEVAAPGLNPMVRFMNWAGKPIPLALFTGLVLLVLAGQRRFVEMTLVVPTLFAHAANWLIKASAASPRPTADLVRITDPSSGWGFPSGHTMATVVICGVVAYLAYELIDHRLGRWTVVAIAGVTPLLVGFSRIYSGAHWPSDVLGAFLWGTLFVIALVLAYRVVVRPRFSDDAFMAIKG
jgi:undecaprenyl-diphosphatase